MVASERMTLWTEKQTKVITIRIQEGGYKNYGSICHCYSTWCCYAVTKVSEMDGWMDGWVAASATFQRKTSGFKTLETAQFRMTSTMGSS